MNFPTRQTLIISVAVILVALGSVWYIKIAQRKAPSENHNSMTTKTLPNTLSTGQATIEKISIGGSSFLVASSIRPVLRAGSAATSSQVTVKNNWVDQFSGVLDNTAHTFAGKYLLSLRRDGKSLFLDVLDFTSRQLLAPIFLGTLASTTTAEVVTMGDAVVDFTVQPSGQYITYVIRRNVVFETPEPGGIVRADSSAEIWTVTVPDGHPTKIATVKPVLLDPVSGSTAAQYDLPLRSYQFKGHYLLENSSGVSVYNVQTKKVSSLVNEGKHGFIRLAVAPSGNQAILYTYQDHSTSTKSVFDSRGYVVDEQLKLNSFPFPVGEIVSTMSWSPQEDFALLHLNSEKTLYLGLANRNVTTLKKPGANTARIVAVHDVLAENTALIGIRDSQAPLDEIPTLDPNELIEMAIWNFQTDTITHVGNYRTPLYLGRVK